MDSWDQPQRINVKNLIENKFRRRKSKTECCHVFIGSVSYADKKKLLDKQEEIREVKQLDDWKPAVSIFSAVLVGFTDKST